MFPFSLPGTTVQVAATPPVKKARVAAPSAFPFALSGSVVSVSARPPTPAVVVRPVQRDPPMSKEEWMAQLEVTPEKALEIRGYEQGTPEWLQSRVGRITSSNFGAAIGTNKYTSPRALVKQMLWGEFKGNAATRWGSENEDVARDEYIQVIKNQIAEGAFAGADDPLVDIAVEECGLVINPERPWMGNSPDGLITMTYASGKTEVGLLEIKCPYRKEFYAPDPVPSYYFAQVQGTMGNMRLPWCDFVVWTPTGIQITRVPFDTAFWDTTLLPGVTRFYFDQYLPLALHKENGRLQPGTLDPLPIRLTNE